MYTVVIHHTYDPEVRVTAYHKKEDAVAYARETYEEMVKEEENESETFLKHLSSFDDETGDGELVWVSTNPGSDYDVTSILTIEVKEIN